LTGAIAHLVRRAARFRAAEAGVAAVEFALVLPIMLWVYIGMVEASALISMDRKIQTISGAVGDLVAREDGEITSAMLGDYVKVASGIMTPYPVAPLEQIVTQVKVSADGSTELVDWSKRYLGGTLQTTGAHAKDEEYNLPDEIADIALGQYVIVAESRYSYLPLYGIVFNQPVNLYRENFYLPRFGAQIVLDPP
jgi:Flp pilus assembly pilin Flp